MEVRKLWRRLAFASVAVLAVAIAWWLLTYFSAIEKLGFWPTARCLMATSDACAAIPGLTGGSYTPVVFWFGVLIALLTVIVGVALGSSDGKSPLTFWLGTVPTRVLALISCIVLFLMMVLTFVDVGGRYLFNSPLPALAEIISFMMAGLVFGALPVVCFGEGHVTIDLLDGFVPRMLKRAQGAFVNVVASGAMFFIAWRLWEKSMSHLEFGEATDELYMDIWPYSMGMAILSVVAAIAQLAAAGAYVTGVRDDPATSAAGRAT